jgi:hypothetical protein
MPLPIIMAAVGGVAKGIQAFKAHQDRQNAEAEQNRLIRKRPKYDIPEEYQQNVDQKRAVQGIYGNLAKKNNLPGQAYMQSRIDAGAANTVAQAQRDGVDSPSQLASVIAGAQQQQREGATDLAIAGAQNRQDNIGNFAKATDDVAQANLDLAGQKQFKWGQNTFSPYASMIAKTTQQMKAQQQRQWESEDDTINSGVALGSFAGTGGDYPTRSFSYSPENNNSTYRPRSGAGINTARYLGPRKY